MIIPYRGVFLLVLFISWCGHFCYFLWYLIFHPLIFDILIMIIPYRGVFLLVLFISWCGHFCYFLWYLIFHPLIFDILIMIIPYRGVFFILLLSSFNFINIRSVLCFNFSLVNAHSHTSSWYIIFFYLSRWSFFNWILEKCALKSLCQTADKLTLVSLSGFL